MNVFNLLSSIKIVFRDNEKYFDISEAVNKLDDIE